MRRGMCGRTMDSVGFVPAHGLAVDPDLVDATAVVVGLFAQMAPVLLRDGASRFTIDHVDFHPLGAALHDAGFGGGSVFAAQPARPTEPAGDVDVRIGTTDDLDAIAVLSLVEFDHRSTPPIYAHPQPKRSPRSASSTSDCSPTAPCTSWPAGTTVMSDWSRWSSPPRHHGCAPPPSPTSERPPAIPPARPGLGHALVRRVLDWAHINAYETVSVDFESSNPLSRPFWLGLGFEPTGFRVRRMIDPSYKVPADQGQ